MLKVTLKETLALARKQLGVAESPRGSNNTVYTRWYGVKTAWCAIFVFWLLRHVRSAWCPDVARWYRDDKRWYGPRDLRPGDQVFFDWHRPGSSGYNHTGVVEVRHGPGDYTTIEGNWLDGVRRVRRRASSGNIVGGGRPRYKPEAVSAPPRVSLSALVKAARSDPRRRQGGTTPGSVDDVRIVEGALKRAGLLSAKYAGDGSYGELTIQAYAAWQRRCNFKGRDADGIPGRSSLVRLGRGYGFVVVD